MIPQQFIDEVQTRTDIVELISAYIPMKRTGRNFKALCPFHSEKTSSFIVSPQKQIFHCFGCGEGGGAFQFLTLIEKVVFPEAVEILAKRLGLVLPYEKGRPQGTKEVFYEAMKEAASFFHNNLKTDKDCQAVRDYLQKRGIGKETINKFLIGYAAGNNSLLNHMRKLGFTLEALDKISLITPRREGFCDLFHNRITFPVFDTRSRVIGFGARIYKEMQGTPKYINSLENILYSKRNHLFGLNFSKDDIIKEGAALIVEGYLDMIIPFMRGVKNIAASLGTALTNEQIRLIKRYTSCVILLYDSDKAGELATLRSLDLLLENGLEVNVLDLPQGFDPDSLIRTKGKDCFLKLLSQKSGFFDYKLGILKKSHDIGSIEGKSKIAQDMFITIDKLNSPIQRYEYIRKLSAALDIKEEIMIAEFRNNFSAHSRKKAFVGSLHEKESANIKTEPLSITEKVLLKFMLTNSKVFSLLKKNLKEEYFTSHLAKKTVSFLFNIHSEKESFSTQKILREINDKEVSSFVYKILMDDGIPSDKNVFKESLLKLRKKGLVQQKQRLQSKMKQAEREGNKQKLKELIKEYTRIK